MPLAESVIKLNAVCMMCFGEASFTKRKGQEKEVWRRHKQHLIASRLNLMQAILNSSHVVIVRLLLCSIVYHTASLINQLYIVFVTAGSYRRSRQVPGCVSKMLQEISSQGQPVSKSKTWSRRKGGKMWESDSKTVWNRNWPKCYGDKLLIKSVAVSSARFTVAIVGNF